MSYISCNLFDPVWESLSFFVSSREIAFYICLITWLTCTSQILLGRISFKQCADVYNHLHQLSGCEIEMKNSKSVNDIHSIHN